MDDNDIFDSSPPGNKFGNGKRKRELSEAELIKLKKQSKKFRHEKLIQQLEKAKKEEEEVKEASNIFDAQPKGQGRHYTVSVALPGSILDNAQSIELRTYLAGQIARALSIFAIDEVVIFDDERKVNSDKSNTTEGSFEGIGKQHGKSCVQLARILQFLECPQYLRKHFFPIHQDLKYAGVLNPTDMPHHLRAAEKSLFREGVVLDRPPTKSGSLVNIGLKQDLILDKKVAPNVRVTVKLDPNQSGRKLYGKAVSPNTPRIEEGLYWGYQVRLADSLTEVLSKSSFKGGYDLTIGTSEKGDSVDEVELKKDFKHLLIVFGGLKGLEAALEADDNVTDDNDPRPLFDLYLNTCPIQGSRTIRTEEAILISLASLRPKIIQSSRK